jgi:hypothetical protein
MKNKNRKQVLTAACAAALLLLCSAPAPASVGEGFKPKPRDRGTFVLIQAEGGFASCPYSQIAGSLGYGLMMGIGGKFKGFPLRFYVMGVFNNALYWHNDTFSRTGEDYRLSLNFMDVGGGLRLLLPIVPKFRVYLDVMGLGSYQKVSLERAALGKLGSSAWTSGALIAAGAEFRWHRNLATGLRVELNFYKKLATSVASTVGVEGHGPGRVFVGLTQSFLF